MDTEAVAMTPFACRARMVRAAKVLPWTMTLHLIADGLLRPSLPGEQDMQGLDRLAGGGQRTRADELGQQLAAEQAMVAQLLVTPLETRGCGSAGIRPCLLRATVTGAGLAR